MSSNPPAPRLSPLGAETLVVKLRSGVVLATRIEAEDEHCVALVATVEGDGGAELLVGTARYDIDPPPGLAKVALAVSAAWRGRGIGSELFRRLWRTARARGVAGFTADVPLGNGHMLALFSNSSLRLSTLLDQGVYRIRMSFPGSAPPARQ